MLSKLKKLFELDEVDHSRRKFIRNAGALAALAVVATSAPGLLEAKTLELSEMIANGLVENQTFYIDETIFIEMKRGFIIMNCKFIATRPLRYMINLSECENVTIMGCTFINVPSEHNISAFKFKDSYNTIT